MMYRVDFVPHEGSGKHSRHFDIDAATSDEAFSIAYKKLKRILGYEPHRDYSDATTSEIPEGVSNIALKVQYRDVKYGGNGFQYIVIRANGEDKAVEYFNSHIKGKTFYQPWPTNFDDNGNCVYEKVAETYFVTCPGFDFDATA